MDDKKSKILALFLVVTLISLIAVAALYLGPSWQFFCVFGAAISVIFAVFIWLIRHRSKDSGHILPQRQKQMMSRELSVPCSFLRKVAGVPTKFRHIDESQVKNLVYVALWCIQEKARRRPTMAQVVDMLEGHLRVDEPPETEMIIVDLLSIDKDKVQGKCRIKATGVILSDSGTTTPAATSTFDNTTIFSGR
ncbi:hypothetical protein Cgig2_014269 [Carnegiea gigantea]|uniref:Uncharacterized protein n=1 Tax=Carnegiea gigantea TaxID=171969 RepID=A0A9Q1GMJ4_9CARY|nr:hypothetical protein Cgig2_014269 [Carnegiea gigantea]